jgi:hypothetical protein
MTRLEREGWADQLGLGQIGGFRDSSLRAGDSVESGTNKQLVELWESGSECHREGL